MDSIASTCSILLAVFMFISSLMQKDINKVLAYKISLNPTENEGMLDVAKKVFRFKAIPLIVASAVLFIAILPISINIIIDTFKVWFDKDTSGSYDISSVAIIIINILFAFIVIYEFNMVKKLKEKIAKLSKKE